MPATHNPATDAGAEVMIAVDPHKASWTAVAVDRQQRSLATIRVQVSHDGYRRLRRFAHRFPYARWAVEGARGLGAPLTARLRADGIEVLEVPAKMARKVRMLSTGHGRKSDEADAYSGRGRCVDRAPTQRRTHRRRRRRIGRSDRAPR